MVGAAAGWLTLVRRPASAAGKGFVAAAVAGTTPSAINPPPAPPARLPALPSRPPETGGSWLLGWSEPPFQLQTWLSILVAPVTSVLARPPETARRYRANRAASQRETGGRSASPGGVSASASGVKVLGGRVSARVGGGVAAATCG